MVGTTSVLQPMAATPTLLSGPSHALAQPVTVVLPSVDPPYLSINVEPEIKADSSCNLQVSTPTQEIPVTIPSKEICLETPGHPVVAVLSTATTPLIPNVTPITIAHSICTEGASIMR